MYNIAEAAREQGIEVRPQIAGRPTGVLHGLLIAGTIRGFRELPSESAIIVIIVAGKIGWEQLAGPMPGSESVSGGAVVVNAHLFGAIGGVIAGTLFWRSAADKPPI